jgi:hypothetical protein
MSVDKDNLVFYVIVWLSGKQGPKLPHGFTEIATDTVIEFRRGDWYNIFTREKWTDACKECWCDDIPFGRYVHEQIMLGED